MQCRLPEGWTSLTDSLTQNSRLLTGVHNSDDVLSLNEVQREALRKAIDAGSMLVHMAVNGGGVSTAEEVSADPQYKDSFLACECDRELMCASR